MGVKKRQKKTSLTAHVLLIRMRTRRFFWLGRIVILTRSALDFSLTKWYFAAWMRWT